MQLPHRGSCAGSHDHTYWPLLAKPTRRCHDFGLNLRQVPKVCPHPTAAHHSPNTHCQPPSLRHFRAFPKATGQRKYLFVAVDHLKKWIEAEAVASITAAEVRKFIWKNIITSFGVPRTMIFDNGWQFDTTKITDYLSTLGCQARFTAVAHPQTNDRPWRLIN